MEETSTHKLSDSDSKLADKGYNIKDTNYTTNSGGVFGELFSIYILYNYSIRIKIYFYT